jgi:hypothetical protein
MKTPLFHYSPSLPKKKFCSDTNDIILSTYRYKFDSMLLGLKSLTYPSKTIPANAQGAASFPALPP